MAEIKKFRTKICRLAGSSTGNEQQNFRSRYKSNNWTEKNEDTVPGAVNREEEYYD